MIVDKLTDEEVRAGLSDVLQALDMNVGDITPEAQRDLLESFIDVLDDLDGDDTFGEDGWKSGLNLEDSVVG